MRIHEQWEDTNNENTRTMRIYEKWEHMNHENTWTIRIHEQWEKKIKRINMNFTDYSMGFYIIQLSSNNRKTGLVILTENKFAPWMQYVLLIQNLWKYFIIHFIWMWWKDCSITLPRIVSESWYCLMNLIDHMRVDNTVRMVELFSSSYYQENYNSVFKKHNNCIKTLLEEENVCDRKMIQWRQYISWTDIE